MFTFIFKKLCSQYYKHHPRHSYFTMDTSRSRILQHDLLNCWVQSIAKIISLPSHQRHGCWKNPARDRARNRASEPQMNGVVMARETAHETQNKASFKAASGVPEPPIDHKLPLHVGNPENCFIVGIECGEAPWESDREIGSGMTTGGMSAARGMSALFRSSQMASAMRLRAGAGLPVGSMEVPAHPVSLLLPRPPSCSSLWFIFG